jgi:hypothetical protein
MAFDAICELFDRPVTRVAFGKRWCPPFALRSSGVTAILDVVLRRATEFHERVVHQHEFCTALHRWHVDTLDSLACCISAAYNWHAGLETFLTMYGGCDDAAGQASFKKNQTWNENRTGVRGCRIDLFTGGGCIRSGSADRGHAAVAELFTEPRSHARRGGNLRRQPGDVLSLRQGEHGSGSRRRAASPGLRMWRLQRLQRLPGLQKLQMRRLRRRLQLLLVVGGVPPVLARTAF